MKLFYASLTKSPYQSFLTTLAVSHKMDFKAVWPRNGHAASLGVKVNLGQKIQIKVKIWQIEIIWSPRRPSARVYNISLRRHGSESKFDN